MRAIGRFLFYVARPLSQFGAVGDVISFVLWLAPIGIPLAFSDWVRDDWRWLAVFGCVVLLLFVVASVKLFREKRGRERIDFSVSAEVQNHGETSVPNDQVVYTGGFNFWATIDNQGPTAEFAASIGRIEGLEGRSGRTDQDGYRVDEVAWEHTEERRYSIGRNQKARLKVATLANDPPRFWFWTARSATYSPHGHAVGIRFRDVSVVSFPLLISDLTHDKADTYTARLVTDSDLPTFTLTRTADAAT